MKDLLSLNDKIFIVKLLQARGTYGLGPLLDELKKEKTERDELAQTMINAIKETR